jgi:CRP-like cAMP-binding protein
MDDLDFSRAGGPFKPAPAPQPQAPLYVPAIARSFFESTGKEETVAAGTVFFAENERASRANATAETDCVLLAINRNVFLNLVKSDPTFGIALLSATAERVRDTAAGVN